VLLNIEVVENARMQEPNIKKQSARKQGSLAGKKIVPK
jgi:hypothetical protein